jgi:hypothetical protein
MSFFRSPSLRVVRRVKNGRTIRHHKTATIDNGNCMIIPLELFNLITKLILIIL